MRQSVVAAIMIAFAFSTAAPASAQSGLGREDLLRLAEIMGGVHYLHDLCGVTDDQKWRNNMQRLIQLERPTDDFKSDMIGRFNGGFEAQRRRFSRCSSRASRTANSLAREGETLSLRMASRIK